MSITSKHIRMLSQIIEDDVKKKIVQFILTENPEGKYHNEICSFIGGSKTSVHKRLVELELSGLIKSKPGIYDGHPVRNYYIDTEELRLLHGYPELLR